MHHFWTIICVAIQFKGEEAKAETSAVPEKSITRTHAHTSALVRNHCYSDESFQNDVPSSLPASQQAGNQVFCLFATHSHSRCYRAESWQKERGLCRKKTGLVLHSYITRLCVLTCALNKWVCVCVLKPDWEQRLSLIPAVYWSTVSKIRFQTSCLSSSRLSVFVTCTRNVLEQSFSIVWDIF